MAKSEEELKGLIGSDIAGFAAFWAPETSYENVRWVAYYLAWVCIHFLSFPASLYPLPGPGLYGLGTTH